MTLLNQGIIKELPPLHSTEHIPLEDTLVICKFFTPDNDWEWFVFEGEAVVPAEGVNKKDYRFFGMVHQSAEQKLDYFLLSELEAIRGPLGFPVKRDLFVPYRHYQRT